MRLLLLACAGGALGAGARHLVGVWALSRGLTGFPWATFTVNVTGSAIMGILIAVLLSRLQPSAELRTFLATGVLGGYTTFSAFSLDAWLLAERGETTTAAIYVVSSVVLSIAALGFGLVLGKWIMS